MATVAGDDDDEEEGEGEFMMMNDDERMNDGEWPRWKEGERVSVIPLSLLPPQLSRLNSSSSVARRRTPIAFSSPAISAVTWGMMRVVRGDSTGTGICNSNIYIYSSSIPLSRGGRSSVHR